MKKRENNILQNDFVKILSKMSQKHTCGSREPVI